MSRITGYVLALNIAADEYHDHGARHLHAKFLLDAALGLCPTLPHLAADVARVRAAIGH